MKLRESNPLVEIWNKVTTTSCIVFFCAKEPGSYILEDVIAKIWRQTYIGTKILRSGQEILNWYLYSFETLLSDIFYAHSFDPVCSIFIHSHPLSTFINSFPFSSLLLNLVPSYSTDLVHAGSEYGRLPSYLYIYLSYLYWWVKKCYPLVSIFLHVQY